MSARVAVVTGANRGLGEQIARDLAAGGLHVLAGSRAGGSSSGAIERVSLDVTREDTIEALAHRLAASGGLDVLVNNAGISMQGFDADVARTTVDVNFTGALRVTARLLPLVRPGGRVVMVSSGLGTLAGVSDELRARFEAPSLDREGLVALLQEFVRDVAAGAHARHGWPSSAYSVSKIGMNALVRVLARELEADPRGILVNAADPGWVRTRMGGAGAPRAVEQGARTPVFLALLPPGSPTGKFFRDERVVPF